jgi:glycosyltransferase involved in cell wall biosynthesis
MRVTHVITRLIVGGAQENTVSCVLGLMDKPSMQVRLLSGAETGPEGSLSDRFTHHPQTLSLIPELVRAVHPWKDLLALRRLKKIFADERPDIVHTHSGKAGILGRLAAKAAGVPVIVHTIHGPSFGAFQGAAANLVFKSAERRAGRVTTHFVAVADAMTRQYLAAGIGTPDQYTKIFSGFPLEPLLNAKNDPELRRRLGIGPEDFVVGKIARLFKLKGYEDLIEAAPKLAGEIPGIKFLVVGDGPWRGRFEAEIRGRNLAENFVFTGLVAPEKVPALVGIMDVLAHLSRREGLARALPMALAAGKPVVAYDCDGAGEVCLNNETGFLIAPGNLGELNKSIVKLWRDAGLRERLGRRGREFVAERFGEQKMVDDLHELYLRLSQQTRNPAR